MRHLNRYPSLDGHSDKLGDYERNSEGKILAMVVVVGSGH
jgi:hypothetical protein